jgi:hypothetical protein
LGNWQLLFAPGNYVARVAGGNLVGGPAGDPIAYTAGVQTLLIQSAASTVVSADGGSTVTPQQIAAAVRANLSQQPLLPVNIGEIAGTAVEGTGQPGDEWGPA